VLVIDEIRNIANRSETVKKEWDADTLYQGKLKVLLLVSSLLLLQQGLMESPSGRFKFIPLAHWS